MSHTASLLFLSVVLCGCRSPDLLARSSFFQGTETLPADEFELQLSSSIDPGDTSALGLTGALGLGPRTELRTELTAESVRGPGSEGGVRLAGAVATLTHVPDFEAVPLALRLGLGTAVGEGPSDPEGPERVLSLEALVDRREGGRHGALVLGLVSEEPRGGDPTLSLEASAWFASELVSERLVTFLGATGAVSEGQEAGTLVTGVSLGLGRRGLLDVGLELPVGPDADDALWTATWVWTL